MELSTTVIFVLIMAVGIPIVVSPPPPGAAIPKTLYADTDPILQLDRDNFAKTVLNADQSIIVEFYKSWCGFCRRFAPIYSRLSQDIKGWSSVVKLAAINCADEANAQICQDNRVGTVPHVKYFRRKSPSFESATTVDHPYALSAVRTSFTKAIVAEYGLNKYPDWPKFDYIQNTSNIDDIWSSVDNSVNLLGIVFESINPKDLEEDIVGEQILLDFSGQNWISFRQAHGDHALVSAHGLAELPAIVIYQRDVKDPIYQSQLHRLFLTDLLGLAQSLNMTTEGAEGPIVSQIITSVPIPSGGSGGANALASAKSLAKKYFASETDLLLSLQYSLRSEVPDRPEGVVGERLAALKAFISTLAKYYPQSEAVRNTLTQLSLPTTPKSSLDRLSRVRQLLGDLDTWLNVEHKSDTDWVISQSDWKKKMDELEKKYNNPFPAADWQHCKGSSPQFRGYTCGLWNNLHAISVHAYLTDGLSGSSDFKPLDILISLREYLRHFFSCEDCRLHFLEMSTGFFKMENNVRYPSDVVLWFWRAHNYVNQRLSRDETEDPDFPKHQFPTDFLCDKCLTPAGWDQREVMRYLIGYYTNIRATPVTDGKVAEFKAPPRNNQTLSAGPKTDKDGNELRVMKLLVAK